MSETAVIVEGRPANDIVQNNKRLRHSEIMDSASSISSGLSTNQSKTSLSSGEQLFDQSHLKPGKHASLLSYSQTLNMYRENAKKTNNPDIQCDFCLFLIEAGNQLGQQNEYYSEAEKQLKQLAVKGHPHAQYHLAKLYTNGVFNNKKTGKPEKAFSLYVQASKRDHMDATYE
jgi:TPR repeat protein